MNVVTRRRSALTALVAFCGAIAMVLVTLPAQGAPPVDEIQFSGERCASGRPTVDVSATGNGRWGVMVIEVSTDGENYEAFSENLNPLRIEHGTSIGVSWFGSVTFRAVDAKNNGDPIGSYVYSEPITCPLS